MNKTGILKNIFNKAWETGKTAYHKAHAAHESIHNVQDKIDRFQAKRQVQHAVRPLNREENKNAAMQHQYLSSAHEQAHILATLYGYSAEEETGLRDRLLAKYKQADSRQEVSAVHSNINSRIENIKRGMAKDKDAVISKIAQGATVAQMGAVKAARSLSTGMGVKPPTEKIKQTVAHNGKTYSLVKRCTNIRTASQKMQKLRESGRASFVRNITEKSGKEVLAVYAAPEVKVKAITKVKPQINDKIQKVIEYGGKIYRFAGKFTEAREAENKISDLNERGFFVKPKNILFKGGTYIAIYAAKPAV